MAILQLMSIIGKISKSTFYAIGILSCSLATTNYLYFVLCIFKY